MLPLFQLSVCLLEFCAQAVSAYSVPDLRNSIQHLNPRTISLSIGNLFHGGSAPSNPLAQIGEAIDDLGLPVPKIGCLFSKDARNCWRENFNILTDSDELFPTSGKTVTVTSSLSQVRNLLLTNRNSMTWRSPTQQWRLMGWSVWSW